MLVFCSYTLRDGLVTIEKLRKLKELISKSADCYIDILDNDSIDKQERVVEELNKAQLVLVLMSPDLKKSVWVKEEYRIANEKKIPIVAININHSNDLQEILSNYEKVNVFNKAGMAQ